MSEQPLSVVMAVSIDDHAADSTVTLPAHQARDYIRTGRARPASADTALAVAPSTPPTPAGNASRQDWADYAGALGVDVPEDMTRDEIRNLATPVNITKEG